MIMPVNQQDIGIGAPQRPGGRQAPEATADDDNAGPIVHAGTAGAGPGSCDAGSEKHRRLLILLAQAPTEHVGLLTEYGLNIRTCRENL